MDCESLHEVRALLIVRWRMIEDFPVWLHLIVLTAASLRIAVLITADEITAPLRDTIVTRANKSTAQRFAKKHPEIAGAMPAPESLLSRLLDCPAWCVGWYTSIGVGLAWLVWPVGTTTVLLPIGIAGLVGIAMPSRSGDDE